ncbi:MAG: helix-turn-helix transcriptional regulator, partial [Chloroflexi bacterium]|nr:helix-turn-helix transcriptional regulator [Chloroflexota bacterium]
MPILRTKLFLPPSPGAVVFRPRLLARIDFAKRLTLVSAPAGFGKTTLVANWMAKREAWLGCWLSLETADNDLTRFLSYLIAALQTANEQIGATLLPNLKNGFPANVVMTTLINDLLNTGDKIVLVLDDYHVIDNSHIHQAIIFLLDHLPPQWHLFLTTRADPPLPIARYRARGQMTELRSADLRFTLNEIEQFLNVQMKLGLSGDDIKQLDERTEGWIASLQLAALALQSSGQNRHDLIANFTGSDRYVMDYLVGDVLQRLPAKTQQFLCQTAVLNRLCAPLCDAVRGADDSQSFLNYLEQANLFLFPLDNQRHWYRYHHLFADLLHYRLAEQVGSVVMLHQRASEWYEQNELIEEAVEHAILAEDYPQIANMIEQYAHPLFNNGKVMTIRHWLTQLPSNFIMTRPTLYLIYGLILYRMGQIKTLTIHLQTPPATLTIPQQGELIALHAHVAYLQGDFARALQLAQDALAKLEEENLALRMPTTTLIGWCQEGKGDLLAAIESHQNARQMAETAVSLTG